jgi:hypothetical protein
MSFNMSQLSFNIAKESLPFVDEPQNRIAAGALSYGEAIPFSPNALAHYSNVVAMQPGPIKQLIVQDLRHQAIISRLLRGVPLG